MSGSPKHVRSLRILALLLVLAGQAALLTHAVDADHQPGEVCEICIGADRLSDGLIATTPAIEPVSDSILAASLSTALIDQRINRTFRSRGPPQI